jgi:hypothetical protein
MAFLHRIHSSPAIGLYMSWLEATNNGICTKKYTNIDDKKLEFNISIYYSSKMRNNTEKILRDLSNQLSIIRTGDVFDIEGGMHVICLFDLSISFLYFYYIRNPIM